MEIEFTLETVKIESKERKLDFGRFRVCSKCGQILNTPDSTCCSNESMSLREYVEQVRGEEFNNDDWSFGIDEDICIMSSVESDAELINILREKDKDKEKDPCPCGTQRCYPEHCVAYQKYQKQKGIK